MSEPLKIAIVEDEFITRRHLKKTLGELGYVVVAEAMSVQQAVEAVGQQETIDLAILDIHLEGEEKDGIWLGAYLQQHRGMPIIYLTAYETPAMIRQALATKPSAYLTKPFNTTDLMAAIELAVQKENTEKDHTLVVKSDNRFVRLKIDDIDYLESEGNYLLVVSGDNSYRMRSTVKQIMTQLPKQQFIQTHRAFIVNKTKVESHTNSQLTIGTRNIIISKGFRDQVKKALLNC
jgi:DNA-binding LytR/AlgR family response regulator